jgi:hemoglobin
MTTNQLEVDMITLYRTRAAATACITIMLVSVQAAFIPANAQQEKQSLYDRLGGLAPISVVVSDFIDALVPDAVLNANPAIDEARKRVPAPYLKYHVTALVCQTTGGTCQYLGRSLKESHAHLNITEHEWQRMVAILKDVLAKHRVPARETQELLDIIDSTRPDIVTTRSSN